MIRVNKIKNHLEFIKRIKEINELEKDRIYCNHGMDHLMDTARLMYIYALEEQMPLDKEIIYAAALLHDIGRGEQYKRGIPHNQAGAMIAENILRECGFEESECMKISYAILNHRSAAGNETSDLATLLYRADKKSRLCFCCDATEGCKWRDEKKNMVIEL